jgi:hypothetical protein
VQWQRSESADSRSRGSYELFKVMPHMHQSEEGRQCVRICL